VSRAVAKILLVVASTATTIIAAELVARWFNVGSEFVRVNSLSGVPTRTVDGVVLWDDAHPRTSSEDIRRVAAARDAFKIVGLGDSIMYGTDQPKENTYLEHARGVLSTRSERPVEILNLAVPGYNTVQENAVYKEIDGIIQPDLVLLHFWGDDIHQFRVSGGYVVDVGDLSADGRLVVRALPVPPRINDFLLLHSRLYDLLTHVVAANRTRGQPPDWTTVSKPLADIHARVQRAGGRLIVLASPQFNGPRPTSPPDLPILRKIASEEGVEVIDLTEWLDGAETKDIAIDTCCHFNAEGHRRVGDHLVEYLLAHDLKPAAGASAR